MLRVVCITIEYVVFVKLAISVAFRAKGVVEITSYFTKRVQTRRDPPASISTNF